jgi:hypothetical protein
VSLCVWKGETRDQTQALIHAVSLSLKDLIISLIYPLQ